MGKKILVVDDEPIITKVLESRLKANGYDVVSAADGQEALNKARSENPDLIILDIMLPKIDGYRVCRLLKFDDKYKNIPILMLTARIQDTDKATGEQCGANAYLPKPFDPQSLLEKIKELLKED
jgi:two-component system, OmpR family, alkaline phosphatase synthesis response regulator PhoP